VELSTDTVDDVAIQAAIDAIDAKFTQLLREGTLTDPVPADVVEAGLLYVNRLLSRRNSPDGVVGVSDLGTATIQPYDADIKKLVGPHLATVLA
jgi:hypothetical protein